MIPIKCLDIALLYISPSDRNVQISSDIAKTGAWISTINACGSTMEPYKEDEITLENVVADLPPRIVAHSPTCSTPMPLEFRQISNAHDTSDIPLQLRRWCSEKTEQSWLLHSVISTSPATNKATCCAGVSSSGCGYSRRVEAGSNSTEARSVNTATTNFAG